MNLLAPFVSPFQIQLCFDKVISQLQQRLADNPEESSIRERTLLEKIAEKPSLSCGITHSDEVEEHEALIREILREYFPPGLTLNEIKAINVPYTNVIFNHTERFKNIMVEAGPDFDITIRDFDEHQFYVLTCCIILNYYYGTRLDFSKPIFYDIPTAKGVVKHYRILYNADFLEIKPTDKSIKLTPEDIDLLMDNYDDLALWKEKFPPDSWVLRGFAIMTLFDATTENAVSTLKEKLLGLNVDGFRESIAAIFRSIYQIPDLRIGLSLFNNEEGILSMASIGPRMQSLILKDKARVSAKEVLGEILYEQMVIKHEPFAVSNANVRRNKTDLTEGFLSQQINSFILAPIVKNDLVLGVLEVASLRTKELNSVNAHKISVVMPFIADTIERLIVQEKNQVQAVIQNNYTSIHESVYWKFELEGQRFVHHLQEQKKYTLQEIIFTDIYPLYGQVDIVDSSEARNENLKKDLQKQLESLSFLLLVINYTIPDTAFIEERQQLTAYFNDLEFEIKADTEQQINSYLENRVHMQLKQITEQELVGSILSYFENTKKPNGEFHLNRRNYENSIRRINDSLSEVIDGMQEMAQGQHPHYYERFKSDGVEHNLYIGPSISLDKKFSLEHLYNLRLWQLRSICEMEKAHYQIKPGLPLPLGVRSLILVFHATISIRFRMDEKRFDVDGSYNARFEIIKKRIDKAFIKNTTERITKEGMICIVYSGSDEEAEYGGYIKKLQSQQLLHGEIETFDVEDLRGVSGLKVMRVKINYGQG